jgi:glucan-binding YG repeat protein
MKTGKKFLAVALSCCMMAAVSTVPAFASTSTESKDYYVGGVGWDVTDSHATVYWDVGDGKTQYKVQIYSSSSLSSSYKVGTARTVSYSAGQADVTALIIDHGSGTFYAKVTCVKDTSLSEVSEGEYIDYDQITTLRKNYKGSTSTTNSGTVSTNGTSTSSTPSAGNAKWVQNADGTWYYITSAGSKAVGWLQINGKWYYFDSGNIMAAKKWIPSASEAGVWYYLGENGDMQTDTTIDDLYTVDAEGKWRE